MRLDAVVNTAVTRVEMTEADVVVNLYLSDGQAFRLASETEEGSLTERRRQRSQAVVKIRRKPSSGEPSSASYSACGLLVSPRYVISCAHAVELQDQYSADRVEVVFPLHDQKGFPGTVIARSPFGSINPFPKPLGEAADDFAVIRLDHEADEIALCDEAIWPGWDMDAVVGRPVIAFGYAVQSASGTWISGTIAGVAERGFEITFDSMIHPGWSGAPVWDLQHGLFALVQSVDRGSEQQTTIAVPIRAIGELGPTVRRRILVVGSRKSDLPEETWRPASALGEGLARESYVLVCGGWPGVDHIVTREFVSALGEAQVHRLSDRLEQVVETGTSPDFKCQTTPTEISKDTWALALAQRGDAVVLVGDLRGAAEFHRAARKIGVPIIPLPGSGGNASQLFGEFTKGQTSQEFPDARALQVLEGATWSPAGAAHVVANAIDLLRDSLDESAVHAYRQCARSMYELLVINGINRSIRNPELMAFVAQLKASAKGFVVIEERLEAANGNPAEFLRATLPRAGKWMILDFLMLDKFIPSWSAARNVQATILPFLLSDSSNATRLEHALAASFPLKVQDENSMMAEREKLIDLAFSDRGGRDAGTRFVERIRQRSSSLQLATDLQPLVQEFLGPVDQDAYNTTFERMWTLINSSGKSIAAEMTSDLITSIYAWERVIGYTFFQFQTSPALVSLFPKALLAERSEAEQHHETRPLWLLLECLESCTRDLDLQRELPPETLPSLLEWKLFLDGNRDGDPGRECYKLLSQIIGQLQKIESTKRLAERDRLN